MINLTKSKSAFVSVCVCFILILCGPTFATAADEILISAHLWEFKSLCELPEPAAHAEELRISGSMGQKGCRNLEEEWGKPVAVRIHLTNPGASKGGFVIDDLASMRLKKSTGLTVGALGFQLRVPDPLGGKPVVGIITEFKGSLDISVPPGQGVDFIVLFKDAAPGDSIIFGKNKPVQIGKEKPPAASKPSGSNQPTLAVDFMQRDQSKTF